MALSDKNIIITPNIGSANDPKIVFSGADASTAAQNITLSAYPTNGGTLSFDGSAGQLFSVVNSMTGTIFSVNDVSGIPSIEVLDTGLIKFAQYSGNVLLGTGTDTGLAKLQVTGSVSLTGSILHSPTGRSIYGPNPTWSSYLYVGGDGVNGITRTGSIASIVTTNGNMHIDSGSDKAMYLNHYSGTGGIIFGNGATSSSASISAGGLLTAAAVTITNGGTGSNGPLAVSGDATVYRSATGGVLYFGSNRNNYIQYDGSNYYLGGSGGLYVGGNVGLTAANYTSYAPTLTGGSASGTWGINITGSAATATDSSKLPLTGGTMTSGGIIKWYDGAGGGSFSSNHYSIGRDNADGGWNHPFPDLIIGYHTGIRIGAHYNYKGTRFYNNSPTTDANNDGHGDGGETQLLTIGDGDNGIRKGPVGSAYTVPFVALQDTAPTAIQSGDMWWQSSTGKLKIYYYDGNTSQWVDAVPIPDTSTLYSKAGGAITGPIVANSSLSVAGTTTMTGKLRINGDLWGPAGDYAALVIRGTYPSMIYRSTTDNKVWLLHHDGNFNWYGANDGNADSTAWTKRMHLQQDGVLYINNNIALHAGNYTSYSPTLTGGSASGTWGISVSGAAYSLYAAGGGGISSQSAGTNYSLAVCMREPSGGSGNTAAQYAPRLGFHWGGVVASSIAMETSGRIAIRDNPGTSYEAFICAAFNATTGTFSGAISASNLSGTNTGDQTNISGNAATTTMSSGRTDSAAYPVVWGTTGGTSQLYSCTAVNIQSSTGTLNATVVTSTSDARVKTNIKVIDNALNKVMSLRGITYDRIDTVIPRQTGVIAQEVLEVLPEAVTGSEETQYAVAYGNMVGLLIEAIKEQHTYIKSQESRITRLESLVSKLIEG